ncbi:MAG: hypothetical protein ACE5FE_10975 [Acidiferrobacterales bacterium]
MIGFIFDAGPYRLVAEISHAVDIHDAVERRELAARLSLSIGRDVLSPYCRQMCHVLFS